MSSSESAKNKLLDTMRMSKSGNTEATGSDTGSTKPSADASTKKSAAPKKPATKKASTKKKPAKKKVAVKKQAKPAAKASADPYQGARRIWPD